MRCIRLSPLLPLSIVLALASVPGSAWAVPADTPEAAARQYLEAEKTFDVASLESVITPGFVEISPVGEIDEHDKVLSFYAPDKKVEGPAIQLGAFQTRGDDDTAIVTTTLGFEMQGHARTLTVGMTATRTATGWKLASAQYTPAKAPVAR